MSDMTPRGAQTMGERLRKWAVKRGKCPDVFGNYHWNIYNPKGGWEGSFLTWREAQDFADKQARTVEVELPRVKPLEDMPIGNYITLSDPGPFIFFINGRGGEYICINDDEIKPLALALLAHARRSAWNPDGTPSSRKGPHQ